MISESNRLVDRDPGKPPRSTLRLGKSSQRSIHETSETGSYESSLQAVGQKEEGAPSLLVGA